MTTLTSWLTDLVAAHGDRTALHAADGDGVSFAELDCRVAGLAGVLAAAGLARGGRLASFVPNGVLPVELLLAAARLGATTVGVNTRYRAEDLRHVLEVAQPTVLVSSEEFVGTDFRAVVARAVTGLEGRPTVLFEQDVAQQRSQVAAVTDDLAQQEDIAVAFTTSGTTGRPKLAAHDHGTTIRHLRAAAASLRVGSDAVALLTLPLCGTFGFVSALAVLAGGGCVVVPDRFVPAESAALIERHRVTHVNGSDDMLLALCEQGRDLASWRHGVQADFNGRGIECVARAQHVGARVTGVYGSSETFALLARWSPDEPIELRARNGGVPVDAATEYRVVGTNGSEVLPGQAGELQLRGPSVLAGYLTPRGLQPAAAVDGWFGTGDLAAMEPGGGFVYVSRMGDALRLAGFLTDPAEIEQHLLSFPAVTGAQVVGATTATGRTVAVAFVTGGPGLDEALLVSHCRDGLANYKVPARVEVVPSFPTVESANGVKVRKAALRDRAATLVAGA